MKNKLLIIAFFLFIMYIYVQYGSSSIQSGGVIETVIPNVMPNVMPTLSLKELLETSNMLKRFQ